MHKESARRYGSAQELADDIRRCLEGQPVLAHPDSSGYRLRKFLGRHRIGVAAASLALAAILGATVVAFWQAAEARRAARDTAQVNAFLSKVIKSSDPMAAGLEIPLSVAVDKAAERIDAQFPGRPDLSAPIRVILGSGMLNRFELETAQRQLQLAFDEAGAAFGPEDLRTLEAKELLAQLRTAQGKFTEAEAMYLELLATLEAQGRRDGAFVSIVVANLGNLYLQRGDYAKAELHLKRAHAMSPGVLDATLQNPNDAPLLLANLATAAQGLGDLDRAEALYAQAQAQMEALDPRDAPELVYILNNRAFLLQERGDGEGAYALWQRSLALRQATYAGDHPLVAMAMANLAFQALALKKMDEGLKLAADAAQMADRIFVVPASDQVYAHLVYAQALASHKQYAAAQLSLDRAEAVLAQVAEPADHLAPNIRQVRSFLCKFQPPPQAPACQGVVVAPAG
jgi:serine/threonine-protein kinase